MLGNIFKTSKLIKKEFSIIQTLFELYVMFNLPFVFLNHDGKFSASLNGLFLTNIDKDLTAILQPLVITVVGLFIL